MHSWSAHVPNSKPLEVDIRLSLTMKSESPVTDPYEGNPDSSSSSDCFSIRPLWCSLRFLSSSMMTALWYRPLPLARSTEPLLTSLIQTLRSRELAAAERAASASNSSGMSFDFAKSEATDSEGEDGKDE